MNLLTVEDLRIEFPTEDPGRVVSAVDGISFQISAGKSLGIVGESGCGKWVTALSLLRLLSPAPTCRVSGRALFMGTDLFRLSEREQCAVRGKEIGMIFQEPMTALNPVLTIGSQIAESIRLHERDISLREARTRAEAMLQRVGIGDGPRRYDEYPHQLSGGMRQRCVIAIALASRPRLLIADEPTTALDATVQAQILDLVQRLQAEMGMAVLWISHDLGVVSEIADDVLVMYAGQAVESARSEALFGSPLHPYTVGLLGSLPPPTESKRRQPLTGIPGNLPDPTRLPVGCRFADRCSLVVDACRREIPRLEAKRPDHFARCIQVKS